MPSGGPGRDQSEAEKQDAGPEHSADHEQVPTRMDIEHPIKVSGSGAPGQYGETAHHRAAAPDRRPEDALRRRPHRRRLWARADVRARTHGRKTYRHPLVGLLELHRENFTLPNELGIELLVLYPAPASLAEDGLRLLANLGADKRQCASPVKAQIRKQWCSVARLGLA
ncbi:hypothetical protein ABZ371_13765 [Streptomyces sp. NPDC005899]|uniref:MmyB family transcriptional regulator n=1 Tax=Streptomyces sp. NPDC005899 TaxID=3155716 RepID=UPI0033E89D55